MSLFESIASAWWAWVWPSFWQFAFVFLLVALADVALRRWLWPQLRLALWLMVVLKLVVPPTLWSPISATSHWVDAAGLPVFFEAAAHTLDKSVGAGEIKLESAFGPAASAASAQFVSMAFVAWLVGVLLIGIIYAVRTGGMRRSLLASALPAGSSPAWLAAEVEAAARIAGLRCAPRWIVSSSINGPAVCGALRPIVALPSAMVTALGRVDVRHALIHECAHIRRGDLWWQAALTGIQILNWPNPLIYWVTQRVRGLREVCCDLSVSRRLRNATADYRTSLLRTAHWLMDRPVARQAGCIGLFESRGNIIVRLRALERNSWQSAGWRSLLTGLVCGAFGLAVLPMARWMPEPCKHDRAQPAIAENENFADTTQ